MDKRGQFYLIMAIIFSLAIFIITSKNNKIQETVLFEDFSRVSQNYVSEAPKTVNYAFYSDKEVNPTIKSFTEDFLSFARKTNPTISLLYVYSNGSNVAVVSYLDETTIVGFNSSKTENLLGGQDVSINDIALNVAGVDFVHHVPVEIKNFGGSFNTIVSDPSPFLSLQIGGIFHNFNLEANSPQLQVILTASDGRTARFYTTGQEGLPPPIRV